MPVPCIDATALFEELKSDCPPSLLDVREDDELAVSRLPNIVHIPLHSLPGRISELDSDAAWVVICRSGVRSAHATTYLLQNGFTSVRNLTAGMNGYATTVDRSLATY